MTISPPTTPDDRPEPALDAVIEAFLAALGTGTMTEFALTPLDTVGVPVWATWWSGGGTAAGGIGYALTEQRARVGALGECIEQVLSSRGVRASERRSGSATDLRRELGADAVVDPRLLALPAGVAFDDDRPLQWLPTRRLRDDAPVWVPAELVASSGDELGSGAPAGGWLTVPVSNGMGAGSSREQAVAHAVMEILQRDGNGLVFRAMDRGAVIDLRGVTDAVTLAALDRLGAAGVEVLPKLAATDFGTPNVYVVGAAPDDDILSATACGEAVHPDREVALRKAVLEFANARARKQFMHGPLEPVMRAAPPDYAAVVDAMDPATQEQRVLDAMVEWLRLAPGTWRPRLEHTVLRHDTTVAFTDLPTTSGLTSAPALLDHVQGRLAAEGHDVLVADFSPPGEGVHAVKVVVPGLEVETVAYTRIGERGTRRLLEQGRDDLVRVGDQPSAQWAPIHLTPDAASRLGGPAWLDRAALTAVADGLLPLYREPGRHTAQKVLQQAARG